MESGTLFTVGSYLGVRSGSVFTCVWNQERFNAGLDTNDDETHDTEKGIKVAVRAIEKLIESDRK